MNKKPLLILVLLFAFLLHLPGTSLAETHSQPPQAASSAFERLFDRVGEAVTQKIPILVKALDRTDLFAISVSNLFYDRKLRRIFFEFKSTISLPPKFPLTDHSQFFTCDGMIAFDVFSEKPTAYRSAKVVNIHGDIVISLDKILYEFAKNAALMGSAAALSQAGDLLLAFLHKVDSPFLAEVLCKAISRFSREAVAVSGAEIIHNASRLKNQRLAEVIKANIQDGDLPTFIALTILKSATISLASISGASLGAAVGNVLVPGPGGVVGAFLGGKITATAAKTVIHKVTVDIPMKILLYKIAKFFDRLQAAPQDDFSRGRLEQYQKFIAKEIRNEVDFEEYGTLDRLLRMIAKFPAGRRTAFVELLKEIQEILRFKLIEQNDWYAAKKMLQFKERIKEWGLSTHFTY
jgi:hypothetical protein